MPTSKRASFRKSIPVAAAVVASLACAPAMAAPDLISQLNNHVEGAIGDSQLSYHEPNTSGGGDFDSEIGIMPAGEVSVAHQGKLWFINRVLAEFDYDGAYGSVPYNGYLQNLQTGQLIPFRSESKEAFTDLDLRVGKGISFFGRDQFTPYGAYGLNAWHRDLDKDTPGGYTEQYRNQFWRAGAEYQLVIWRKLVMRADGSYGRTVAPKMNPSSFPATFELGTSPIHSYDLGFTYLTSRDAYVGIEGNWMKYMYQHSPVENVDYFGQTLQVQEPTSKTTRETVMFVFGYAYR